VSFSNKLILVLKPHRQWRSHVRIWDGHGLPINFWKLLYCPWAKLIITNMSLSFFPRAYLLFSLESRTENGEPPSPTVKHAATDKASILSNSNSPSPLFASISHLWFFICLNLSTNPKRVTVSISLILHLWRYICWNWN